MEKQIIVNMLAGPGAGKSTTAAALFTLLKLHQGIQCELVPEFAKDLVWEERQHTLTNQNYVFSKQQHRIWRVSQKVDITITDSPILLSCIYQRDVTTEKFKDYVLEEFNGYNNLNFFIERTKRYVENGRNQTKKEAIKIDEIIKGYLSENSIYFYPIEGNMEGINVALNLILNEIGRKSEFEIMRK
jgi:hypothetical protein